MVPLKLGCFKDLKSDKCTEHVRNFSRVSRWAGVTVQLEMVIIYLKTQGFKKSGWTARVHDHTLMGGREIYNSNSSFVRLH